MSKKSRRRLRQAKSDNSLLSESYICIRASALNNLDKNSEIRFSHENSALNDMYKNYMGEIGGEKAEKLLHTSYSDKSSEFT